MGQPITDPTSGSSFDFWLLTLTLTLTLSLTKIFPPHNATLWSNSCFLGPWANKIRFSFASSNTDRDKGEICQLAPVFSENLYYYQGIVFVVFSDSFRLSPIKLAELSPLQLSCDITQAGVMCAWLWWLSWLTPDHGGCRAGSVLKWPEHDVTGAL